MNPMRRKKRDLSQFKRSSSSVWQAGVPSSNVLRVQQHRICSAECNRFGSHEDRVWRTYLSKGACASWPERQRFGSDTVRVQSGAVRYGLVWPYDPAPHHIHACFRRPVCERSDLALFGLFNMRDRAKAQAAILSEQNIDELHQPVFTGRSGVVTTFGWFKSQTASGFPSSSRAAVIQVSPTECALFRRKT